MRFLRCSSVAFILAACGPSTHMNPDGASGQPDASAGHDGPSFVDGPQVPDAGGCSDVGNCYTVYAHGDHILYRIDLAAKALIKIGPFNAPMVGTGEDVITDLAVAPDDTIWVVSKTNLYTASAVDGHVTLVGSLASCGTQTVALTFTPDAKLYAADFQGAFCRIDTSQSPPAVIPVGTLGSGLAIAGDLVAVADGTMYGTAYRLSDPANMGTQINNILVKIDPATGQVLSQIGMTGFPKLFGIAYEQGQVFGFTHDGTGTVITIDPTTGVGTLYGTFMDPTTMMGIRFAGAGVNALVPPTVM